MLGCFPDLVESNMLPTAHFDRNKIHAMPLFLIGAGTNARRDPYISPVRGAASLAYE
jgi:hypothetical protein